MADTIKEGLADIDGNGDVANDLAELSRARGPARHLALGGLIEAASQRITHSAVRRLDGKQEEGRCGGE